jgi:hypothetical protein
LNYRASQNGKEKRREQAARYRVKTKEQAVTRIEQPGIEQPGIEQPGIEQPGIVQNGQSDASADPCEGYHKDDSQEKSSCHRPGCYKRFTPPPRSPLQKFCCPSCQQALRAVLIRERRWLQWLAWGFARTRDGPL